VIPVTNLPSRGGSVVALAALLCAGAFLAAPTDGASSERRIQYYPASDAELDDAVSQGLEIVEKHGRLVVADASSSTLDWLDGENATYHECSDTTGRTNLTGDPVEESLVPSYWRTNDTPLQMVQFKGALTEAKVDRLETNNMTPLRSLHSRTILVDASGATEDPENVTEVRWAGAYHPGFRVHHTLRGVSTSTSVLAVGQPNGTVVDLSDAATGAGCDVSDSWNRTLPKVRCEANRTGLRAMAGDPATLWVEPAESRVETYAEVARKVVQTGEEQNTPFYDRGLRGEEQRVVLTDTGVYTDETNDAIHRDLRDPSRDIQFGEQVIDHQKIASYYAVTEEGFAHGDRDDDNVGHGTRMASVIAGDDRSDGEELPNGEDGVAPASRLIVQDIGPDSGTPLSTPSEYEAFLEPGYDLGGRIFSNSWGTDPADPQFYSDDARQLDAFAWDHPDAAILYAAGNSGEAIPQEAAAKNVLTVGAVENPNPSVSEGGHPDDVWDDSGQGPTADGRIKPDVMAPGAPVTAATTGGEDVYEDTVGTSPATAAASGSLALLRQYFQEGWHPTGTQQEADEHVPSGAELRASVTAGSTPITGDGAYGSTADWPNGRQGFGRLELDRSVFFEGEDGRLWTREGGALGPGEDWAQTITVQAGADDLNVSLVWDDCPGVPGAKSSLCNDLHLIVRSPAGVPYVGNNLAVDGDGPHSLPGGAPDLVNVVETVRIPEPTAGTWVVEVVGGSQNPLTRAPSFAVAATGEIGAPSLNLAPSSPDQAIGPTLSKVGNRETYDIVAPGDPDGTPIMLEIDWGDGTSLETDYINGSGDGISVGASHYWWTDGLFDVRSRSVDTDGAVSPWSDPLQVEVYAPRPARWKRRATPGT